jgi:hypothetical protein
MGPNRPPSNTGDFYLLTGADMRNKKRGRIPRFGHETTDGDTEILDLSASQIVFTRKFKRPDRGTA